jgi:YidC/Oxa1 family membrane protein insertase
MDIKRGLLWFVFLFSLLTLWNNWNVYNGKAPMFGAAPPAGATLPNAPASANATAAAPAGANAAASATATAAPTEAPFKAEDVTITTDVFKATFDTAGAKLKRLELLQYQETKAEWLGDVVMDKIHGVQDNGPRPNVVIFDNTAERTYLAETGLTDAGLPGIDSGYTVRAGSRTLDNGDTLQLVFDAEKNGVKLTKTFTFKRGQYAIDVKHEVTNNTAAAIAPTLDLRLVRDGTLPKNPRFAPNPYTGPAASSDTKSFEKQPFEKIAKNEDAPVKQSNNGWVAMVQHFFVSAFVPPANTAREVYSKTVGTNLYAIGNTLHYPSIAPGATATIDTTLYSGPQDIDALGKVSSTLELTRDYGTYFTFVAKPIFAIMNALHKVVGNWGWTIIVFTVLMKVVLYPLAASSFRSMAKTKQLQPKMTSIRERYKDDAQKMNQAMMELYKTEKINPIGGCLPLLVQMPIFIALYSVLSASVETRDAAWIGWVHDLSTPDPYSILPLVMAVAMFFQTRLSPAPPDPTQAKVMMFMPIVFSVMFFMFPSGVVLYYVVNTVLSIAQQQFINKRLAAAPAPKKA